MILSTSYKGDGFKEIITGIVKLFNPKIVVELGTQQGSSAILIGQALSDEAKLYTYDLFNETYDKPPYSRTSADLKATQKNILINNLTDKVVVRQRDALRAHKDFSTIDILHVDLCNHLQNVQEVLIHWHDKVNKAIILEGGVFNKWQREKDFAPFNRVLEMEMVKSKYDVLILKKNEDYAITLLIRK